MADEMLAELRAIRMLLEAQAGLVDLYDYQVHIVPKTWTRLNEGRKGWKFSQCSPRFLTVLADCLDFLAGKEEAEKKTYKGKPQAPYTRAQAAMARRWALRKRLDGWQPSAESEQQAAFGGGGSGFGDDAAAQEKSRYGTSGHGANAKHTGTPERDAFGAGGGFDDGADAFGDEDEIPF